MTLTQPTSTQTSTKGLLHRSGTDSSSAICCWYDDNGIPTYPKILVVYPEISWCSFYRQLETAAIVLLLSLDLDLLTPLRVLASASADAHDDTMHPSLHHAKHQQAPKVWLEYAYRKNHPAPQWLPTELAKWIGENLHDDLGFPDMADPRRSWTPTVLNNLMDRLVIRDINGCSLLTFGCVELESEDYRGIRRARCYPFKMRKHNYRGMNPQVNM
jgi:hypothetical protein